MICQFTGQYKFLSNFFVEPDGSNVEREYQAQKCLDPSDIVRFSHLSGGDAKRLGRRIKIRPDWDYIKLETMRALVWQKFVDHLSLAKALLETGDEELIEGNTWGDRFWGKSDNGWGSISGDNWLGKILMETRERIRALK